MNPLDINGRSLIFIVIILILVLLLFISNYIFYGIFFLLFLIFSFLSNRQLIIQSIIVGFIVLSSDIQIINRNTLVLFFTSILIYYLIKDKGLNLVLYERIPTILVCYILITLASMFLSSVFSSSILIGTDQTLRQFFFFFILFLLYNIVSFNEIKIILIALAFVGMIISLGILYQFILSGFSILWFSNFAGTRFGGLISNVNSAGGIIGVSITIVFLLYLLHNKKNNYGILFFTSIFLMLIALLLTNSRASIGAAFISLFFVLFVSFPQSRKYLLSIPLIVLSIFILTPSLNDFLTYYFRLENLYANREYFWQLAISIFRDNWILGVGPGQFENHIYNSIPFMIGTWPETQILGLLHEGAGTGHAHNFYLFYASELGLPGLALALTLPTVYVYFSMKLLNLSKKIGGEIEIISVALIGIGIGLFVRSFFESTGFMTYGWISRDLPFWLVFIVQIKIFYHIKKLTNFDE